MFSSSQTALLDGAGPEGPAHSYLHCARPLTNLPQSLPKVSFIVSYTSHVNIVTLCQYSHLSYLPYLFVGLLSSNLTYVLLMYVIIYPAPLVFEIQESSCFCVVISLPPLEQYHMMNERIGIHSLIGFIVLHNG